MTAKSQKNIWTLIPVITLWSLVVATGLWFMLGHEFEAADSVPAPTNIPLEIGQIAAATEVKPLTLVMAVHPNCPCTSASIEQLDRLMARNPDSITAIALFCIDDDGAEKELAETNDYWKRIAAIPNAIPSADSKGMLAEKLGALVSGAVVAYDDTGALRFTGGLTPSRGHAGSSAGMNMLEAIARKKSTTEVAEAPTFGCALAERSEA